MMLRVLRRRFWAKSGILTRKARKTMILRIVSKVWDRPVGLFGRGVGVLLPERARKHEIGARQIACDGDVVYAALAQEHLNVGFVRLRVEIVDEKDGKIDFFSHDHGGDFGVAAHRSGMHALDIARYAVVFVRFADERSGRAGAYEFMFR